MTIVFSSFNLNTIEKTFAVISRVRIYIYNHYLEIMLIPISLVAVFFLHLMSSIRVVRFGTFYSERIGHFFPDVAITYAKNDVADNRIDIYSLSKYICNSQIKKMAEREFIIKQWVYPITYALKVTGLFKEHYIVTPLEKYGSRDWDGVIHNYRRFLEFTSTEEGECKEWLMKKGIFDSDKFICLIVRDSKYVNELYDDDKNYHNYRDSNIDDYVKASEYLANKGYYIIRMGTNQEKRMPARSDKIIDYAFEEESSPLLDVWLMAKCYFCVTSSTGLDEVSKMYDLPMVTVNVLPLHTINLWSNCMWVMKKLYWKESGQLLNMKEYMQNSYLFNHKYMDCGIEIEDLSEDEILQAVAEMEAWLSGEYSYDEKYKDFQIKALDQLKELEDFEKYHGFINENLRIGYCGYELNRSSWL